MGGLSLRKEKEPEVEGTQQGCCHGCRVMADQVVWPEEMLGQWWMLGTTTGDSWGNLWPYVLRALMEAEEGKCTA